jgi:hypothetical protein
MENSDLISFQLNPDSFNLCDACLGHLGRVQLMHSSLLDILYIHKLLIMGTINLIGQKRDEVTGEWRKLHNKELHDLYSSTSIIRIIKSRRMRWAGHVARMGRRGTLIDYWWESQMERDH